MLRINDIIEKCKISRPTLYEWFNKGLKFHKVGKLVFVYEEDLDKFLKGEK